ncbi:hypothetical protein C8R44DRAFT_775331 [Mycena epipterygia]|nr:hypothetical protein C8R44DRAFT_826814 [Mycena epipterygia]KAJ7130320.1 hypothetical protein C8R44DRAFT_775331 [Mycena epipterygia]
MCAQVNENQREVRIESGPSAKKQQGSGHRSSDSKSGDSFNVELNGWKLPVVLARPEKIPHGGTVRKTLDRKISAER